MVCDMQHKMVPLTLWSISLTEIESPVHAFHSSVKTNYIIYQLYTNQAKQTNKNILIYDKLPYTIFCYLQI